MDVDAKWTAAQALRAARASLRLTQQDACTQAGIPLSTWSSWETGKVQPSVERLAAAMHAIGADLSLNINVAGHTTTIHIHPPPQTPR